MVSHDTRKRSSSYMLQNMTVEKLQCVFCCWTQHTTLTLKRSRFQHNNMLPMILCFQYCKMFHKSSTTKYDCCMNPTYRQTALMQFATLLEENPDERLHWTIILVRPIRQVSIITLYLTKKLFFSMIIRDQFLVINISDQRMSDVVYI